MASNDKGSMHNDSAKGARRHENNRNTTNDRRSDEGAGSQTPIDKGANNPNQNKREKKDDEMDY